MPCTKICFPSHADARHAASRSGGLKLRPYQCPICKCYHLSSMSAKERRALRKRIREHKKMPVSAVACERERFDEITKK